MKKCRECKEEVDTSITIKLENSLGEPICLDCAEKNMNKFFKAAAGEFK